MADLTGPFGASTGARQITLQASSSAVPFCIGHAFKQGDVPTGSTVALDSGSLQATVKNRWADGSIKFAVLAGQVTVTPNAPTTLPLRVVSTTPLPAALTTTALKATSVTASVGCGAFGTVSWATTDWGSPFMTWVSGPVMSSWIYRKPVGSDPHLVAWLEVRLFASGAVEVLPWIENGYLLVAGPTNKSATYTFSLGGTQRFSGAIDLKHHQRTPLIGDSSLSYWLGSDPGVTIRHDAKYLQATELVPTYSATVSASASVVAGLVSSYTPLQAGNIVYQDDSMPGTGYQPPIGLLPEHDVLYLTADVAQAFAAVVRNGFSAGRYGLHYRDESTNRPLRFSVYPTLSLRDSQGFKDNGGSTTSSYAPATTGGNPPTWDVAHSPSVGFMAYLLTGRFYFMEEVQFATTTNYLGNGDNSQLRTGSQGLVQTCTDAWQTRSCAWDWRTRVQALAVTPDDDVLLRSEFIASVEANAAFFHSRYVAQVNNPYGWVMPGESGYDGTTSLGASWQQDFVTAAFGYSLGLGLPIAAAAASKLAAFFQWKAKSIVMRLGPQSGFWYINAAPYLVKISATAQPDYVGGTGPWFATDAQVYAATYTPAPSYLGATEGVLAGEIVPGDRAQWGNLMPAIAYAVRYAVPGAQAAYSRLTGASNYAALATAFNGNPVWSVKPAAIPITYTVASGSAVNAGRYSWMPRKLWEWVAIPNTNNSGTSFDQYSGIAFKPSTAELIIAAAGGHRYDENSVRSCSLLSDSPAWVMRIAPSGTYPQALNSNGRAYNPDGKPAARHTYGYIHYIPQTDRVVMCGAYGLFETALTSKQVDAVNVSTWTWDAEGRNPDIPAGGGYGVGIDNAGLIYVTGNKLWNDQTRTWGTHPLFTSTTRFPVELDTSRNRLFCLMWGNSQGNGSGIDAISCDIVSGQTTAITLIGPAIAQFIADAPAYPGMTYDECNDEFVFCVGNVGGEGRFYRIKPNAGNTWLIRLQQVGSSSATPPSAPLGGGFSNGINKRLFYSSKLRGLVLAAQQNSNIYFMRTA